MPAPDGEANGNAETATEAEVSMSMSTMSTGDLYMILSLFSTLVVLFLTHVTHSHFWIIAKSTTLVDSRLMGKSPLMLCEPSCGVRFLKNLTLLFSLVVLPVACNLSMMPWTSSLLKCRFNKRNHFSVLKLTWWQKSSYFRL